MAEGRPIPTPSPLTRPFWDAAHQHQLVIQRCTECGKLTHPPMPACPNCLSMAQDWAPSKGDGKVYSYNITHRPPLPAFGTDPYVVALIELDDMPGIRIASNVIGCDPKEVYVGMPVKVVFQDVSDDVSEYRFVPRK